MRLKAAIIAALIILVVGTLSFFAFQAMESAITVNLNSNANSAANASESNANEESPALTPPAATGDLDAAVTAIISGSLAEQDIIEDDASASVISSDSESVAEVVNVYDESDL